MRLSGEALAQKGDEALVQLHGDHAAGLLRDQLGEHAGAGADLQHGIGGRQPGRGHDAVSMRRIYQEVLAEALFRRDAQDREPRQAGIILHPISISS